MRVQKGQMHKHVSLCLGLIGFIFASNAAAEDSRGSRNAAARDHEAAKAALTAKGTVPADAPKPIADADKMKKTPLGELSKHAGKKLVTNIENFIYSQERLQSKYPIESTSPSQQKGLEGIMANIREMRSSVDELAQLDAAWSRLGEYRNRLAGIEKWTQAQLAFIGATAAAKTEAVTAKRAELQADWDKKRVVDEGPLHALHKDNIGKILFSTKEIAAETNDAKAFVASTTPEAPLFMRAYLAESPWNLLHRANVDCGAVPEIKRFALRTFYTVNGGTELELENLAVDEAAFSKKTSFAPTKSGSLTAGGSYTNETEATAPFAWLAGVVGGLKPGDNTVKLEMRVFCEGAEAPHPVANGELTIKATAANLAAAVKRGSFKMTPSIHDKAALAGLSSKVSKRYAGQFQMLDFRTANDWKVNRNSLGVILSRSLKATALMKDKTKPGCTMYSLELVEPWAGNHYGATEFSGEFARPFVCSAK